MGCVRTPQMPRKVHNLFVSVDRGISPDALHQVQCLVRKRQGIESINLLQMLLRSTRTNVQTLEQCFSAQTSGTPRQSRQFFLPPGSNCRGVPDVWAEKHCCRRWTHAVFPDSPLGFLQYSEAPEYC